MTEIATKLQRADAMSAEGRLHNDIAKALGVSVMTYHRWRKARGSSQLAAPAQAGETTLDAAPMAQTGRIKELQVENSRLRRLVTDLLLEKMSLQEGMHGRLDSIAARR